MKTLAVPLLLMQASIAQAQAVATDVDVTAGYSTEHIRGAASQIRTFGEAMAGVRFFAEGAWAPRSADTASDVFGGAYPYGNRVRGTASSCAASGSRGGRSTAPRPTAAISTCSCIESAWGR